MAHKQRPKRTTPTETPVSKKLPPPSSPPPPPSENEQQQQHETPQSPPAHSPKRANKKKKGKKQNEVEEPRVVAPAPRIIWKVEDETELLKCMAAFIASTGLDPYKDAEALRSFAKESECSLPEASAYQLKEKIRRMRRKFAQGSGGHKFIELAKKVWEPEKNTKDHESRFEEENNNKKGSKRVLFREPEQEQEHILKGGKRVRFVEPEREEEEEQGLEVELKGILGNWSEVFGSCVPGMSEECLNKALRLIEGSKRAEWEKKWEELKMAELELFVHRAELIRDQARLMLAASKSSKLSN